MCSCRRSRSSPTLIPAARDEGLVTLMTLHNAKGLEYPIVFIAGCEDGVFPHSRAIDEGALEEERRLFYVGVTRAMRQLYLTYARRRAVFGAQTTACAAASSTRSRRSCSRSRASQRAGEPVSAWGVHAAGGSSAVGGVAVRDAAASPGRPGAARGRPRAAFRLGEDVVHAAFGEGVVTGAEPDGVIVVRFAGDGLSAS